jgi:hypothetical protein
MKDDVSNEVSKELLGKDVLALDPFDIIKIEKKWFRRLTNPKKERCSS